LRAVVGRGLRVVVRPVTAEASRDTRKKGTRRVGRGLCNRALRRLKGSR
jgi:hypothetical protein